MPLRVPLTVALVDICLLSNLPILPCCMAAATNSVSKSTTQRLPVGVSQDCKDASVLDSQSGACFSLVGAVLVTCCDLRCDDL